MRVFFSHSHDPAASGEAVRQYSSHPCKTRSEKCHQMCRAPKLLFQSDDEQPVLLLHVIPVEFLQQINRFARKLGHELISLVKLPADLELILSERSRRDTDSDLLAALGGVNRLALQLNGTDTTQRQKLQKSHNSSTSQRITGV